VKSCSVLIGNPAGMVCDILRTRVASRQETGNKKMTALRGRAVVKRSPFIARRESLGIAKQRLEKVAGTSAFGQVSVASIPTAAFWTRATDSRMDAALPLGKDGGQMLVGSGNASATSSPGCRLRRCSVPPCRLAMAFTIERPRPLPGLLRLWSSR
jgi:hypothetical protein